MAPSIDPVKQLHLYPLGPAATILGAFGVALFVAACGRGGSGEASAPPLPPPLSAKATDAARLLDQATFGVTASDAASVQSTGIDSYISAQLALPAQRRLTQPPD